MTSENKKFVELVEPDSVFEAAGGRVGLFGYSTTQETLRMQYGASPTSQVAFMAKRNGPNTFTGLQTFGAGFVNTLWVGEGFRPLIANAEGVGQPTDAATFMASGLGISAFVQTILDDADASAVRSTIGAQGALGYTPVNKAGDTMIGGLSISGTLSANDVLIRHQSGTSQSIGYLHSTTGNLRLITRFDETIDSFDTVTRDDSGNARNTALSIPRTTATAVKAGGSGGQPWNFTGGVWTGGTPRVSAAGRFDATSLYNSAWAGGGIRPLLTDNAGMGYATDAATFRTAIGAQVALGYTPVNKAGDTFTGQVVVTDPTNVFTQPKLLVSVGGGSASGEVGFHSDGASVGNKNWGAGVSRDFSCFRIMRYTDDWSGFTECIRVGTDYLDLSNPYANALAVGYKIGGLKVVGGRKIGWAAPTGTATRTTFATSTVTLPQLAERLKALIDDLTAHGLIGA